MMKLNYRQVQISTLRSHPLCVFFMTFPLFLMMSMIHRYKTDVTLYDRSVSVYLSNGLRYEHSRVNWVDMITVERVDVVGIARIKESFLGQTWIYALSVQKNKTEKYTIYKRWNEVYDLHHRLVKDYPATMGYEMPTFPKSHFYESKKVAEERIADLSGYFVALLECNFCRACLPLKDFLFASDADKVRHELYTAEKRKEKPERSSVSSLEIGAPVAQAAYTLEKAWEPAEFNATMKNLLPPMKSGEVSTTTVCDFVVIVFFRKSL